MAGIGKCSRPRMKPVRFFEVFKPLVSKTEICEIVICPPFPNIPSAIAETEGTRILVGAQNLYWGKEGAVTGEVSGHMIQALGCTHVIVAHSERRQYFGETEEDVLRKTMAALDFGLTPIVCVGEKLEEREGGATEEGAGRSIRGRHRRLGGEPIREDSHRL